MGLQHLLNKRSGRPKGSKTSPPWARDLRWAYKNLGRPDAVPPTALAGLLVALGREHPDRLVACLVLLDSQAPKAEQRERDANDAQPRGGGGAASEFPDYGPSRRLREVTVSEGRLFAYLRAGSGRWVHTPPHDAHVVGVVANISQRTIRLVIHSEDFPVVEEGKPIPELEKEWSDGSR